MAARVGAGATGPDECRESLTAFLIATAILCCEKPSACRAKILVPPPIGAGCKPGEIESRGAIGRLGNS